MITTILFDLGGTLWDDYASEQELWRYMREELAKLGVILSDGEYEGLMNRAIQSYAPSLTRAILWSAVNGDYGLYQKVLRKILNRFRLSVSEGFHERTQLYPGVREMLAELHGRYKLAVASNNITLANGWLQGFGIDRYFGFIGLSEELWLFKPDARLFLHILEAVGANAKESVMVGDRLDNDIFPCNRLGMVTVRVLSPPWDRQQPRFHADVPDFTLDAVAELPDILARLEGEMPPKPHQA